MAKPFLSTFLLVCASSSLQAATIYEQTFTGGGTGDLDGTTAYVSDPSTPAATTWVANSAYKLDGTFTTVATNNTSALLGFTAVDNQVYVLEITMGPVTTTDTTSRGVQLGFATNNDPEQAITGNGFLAATRTRSDNTYSSQTDAPGSWSPDQSTGASGGIFEIALDTTAGDWKATFSFNGNPYLIDQAVTSSPGTLYVGYAAGVQVTSAASNFSLSVVPEPTSALAGALLGAGLLRRRRSL